MAGGDKDEPHGENQEAPCEDDEAQPCAEFRMELRDSLPGDKAVIGIEQDGEVTWLASKKYIHPKAVDEFVEQITRMLEEGSWVQNWPGAR